MAKLVKKVKRPLGGLRSYSAGGSAEETSSLRPVQMLKTAPCSNSCPNGTNIRDFLTAISWTEDTGRSYEESFEKAWNILVDNNPFPSICGKVCPHPCEGECNRNYKDDAVGINDLERFVGDYALQKEFKFKSSENTYPQKVAVIGAGPAGLSCAYQLARRGYQVKVFEGASKPGGMLRYRIPDYRLPKNVLDKEIKRIGDLGVEIQCDNIIGKNIPYYELQKNFDAIYVGIGARKQKKLGVSDNEVSNVLTVTEFLTAPIELTKDYDDGVTTIKCEHVELGDDIQIDKNAVSEYAATGLNIQIDVVNRCLSKCMDWDGKEISIDNKVCRKCMRCIKAMPKALSLGKDAIELGQVASAIFEGRKAANAIHNRLQNIPLAVEIKPQVITHDKMILSYYESKQRNESLKLKPEKRLLNFDSEITSTLTEEQAIAEANRCMSCGSCFDCGTCWSYCQDQVIVKPLVKHQAYKFKLEFCKGCNKCAESCPCGYITMS
jgi:NADPH-dependent glutamate synthase beta subunit-like oxidoreductase